MHRNSRPDTSADAALSSTGTLLSGTQYGKPTVEAPQANASSRQVSGVAYPPNGTAVIGESSTGASC